MQRGAIGMLNELHLLAEALTHMNIQQDSWHREYKELPNVTLKSPCYQIWLSQDGSISHINELEAKTVKALRKFGSNQRSFPAFNIRPLYRITGAQRQDNWIKSFTKIDKALKDISRKLLEIITSAGAIEKLPVVIKLIEATQVLTDQGLRNELERYILNAIERGDERFRSILEFKGNETKSPDEDMGNNISVIFDYEDWRSCGRQPVAHEDTTWQINNALNHAITEKQIRQSEGQAVDAFGAIFDSDAKPEPMPEVKLPGYSSVLRTMFHGQPCLERYGRFDDASYPISKVNRAAAKTALEFIARPDNNYKTWVKADTTEIIFVYPEKLKGMDNKYASILAPQEEEGEEGELEELVFEAAAEDFTRVFNALPPENKPEYIQIFSLQRADKSSKRSKVVFTRSLSPQYYIDCACEWRDGCSNIPEIASVIARTPFPTEIAAIFNTVWKRDGDKYTKNSTCMKHYQGMELLLNDLNRDILIYYLRILNQNAGGLVVYAGSLRFFSEYYIKAVAAATAMFGLLLYKCGVRKENYMTDTAFMTGRLLRLCDELHTLYCRVERKGEVPPQLAGASMLTTASDSPDRAIAIIQKRMMPYITWAKTYRYRKNLDEKSVILQRTAISRMTMLEELAELLFEKLTTHITFTDLEKAQLFLGYLATLPKKEANTEGENSDESKN
jgi:hypothetical protein